MPREELRSSLIRSVTQISVVGLALLVAALVGAWWVARGITRPVRSLAASAHSLQRGRAVLPQATGIREFDQVSAAIAEASENILRAHHDMEREVAAAVLRTREAEQLVSHSQRVEALGRLTGGVAHDFNNLLGVISNSAHLMQRLPPDRDRSAPLAAIQRAVEVGSRLTQHLLRFARRQPVQPALVDLRSTLPDSAELLRTVVGASVRIHIDVAPDTPPVRVDAGELELALINLALNARDAMPGGGQLTLSARPAHAEETSSLPGGPFVAVGVADSGSGVPAELRERVFEPFFTTKVVGKGTGLGLSQVHGFCAQAGGDARIDTAPGAGTIVTLLLPAARPAPATTGSAAGDATGTPSGAVSAAPEHAKGTVLLVEDNASLGDVTEALLRSFGYAVLRAASADEALRLLDGDAARVDIVLSDVVMPGEMDGMALAQHLRAHRPGLPVVLLTGFSAAMKAPQGFTLLHKPTPPNVLLAALRDGLDRRETQPAS